MSVAKGLTMTEFLAQTEQVRTHTFFDGHPCEECHDSAINHWTDPAGTIWCLRSPGHHIMFKASPPRSYGVFVGEWQWSWSCSCGEPKHWVVGDELAVKARAGKHLGTVGVGSGRMVAA